MECQLKSWTYQDARFGNRENSSRSKAYVQGRLPEIAEIVPKTCFKKYPTKVLEELAA